MPVYHLAVAASQHRDFEAELDEGRVTDANVMTIYFVRAQETGSEVANGASAD